MNKIDLLKSILTEFKEFLDSQLRLVNCHMVDFIVKDHWNNIVNENIKKDLENYGIEYFRRAFFSQETSLLAFNDFLNKANIHTLGFLKEDIILSRNKAFEKFGGCLNDPILERLNGCLSAMSDKKIYEVRTMSRLIVAITENLQLSQIVDLGGGRGYLTSLLALHNGLKVLSVDSAGSNTISAQKRSSKMEKAWDGIINRIKLENELEVPNSTCQNSKKDKKESDYRHHTLFVTPESDLISLFREEFPNVSEHGDRDQMGLIGLHTCGNLASTALQLFTKERHFGYICTVGCCYHLLNEEQEIGSGFPISQFLKNDGFSLRKNARMLASQSVERNCQSKMLPIKSLYFRAVLQDILMDKLGNVETIGHVGRIAVKCNTFSDYVIKATKKLDLSIKLSENEIENYYQKNLKYLDKIEAFFFLRISLAPVIESIILLDRLLYLYEQGYQQSFLTQLFDPIVSPRCYAIVGLKERNIKK